MNESTAIVVTYMNANTSGELVVFFKGASAESAFATWLKVVGVANVV